MPVYSLELRCHPDEVEQLTAEFWEAGTLGIRELEENGMVRLIAGFEETESQELLSRFARYYPQWRKEEDTNWAAYTEQAWPGRLVGQRFFVCPPWHQDLTPTGRIRLIQNPGLASGTGEHPCTQLAMQALESVVQDGMRVADVGTGSGILAIAACLLGAAEVIGLDPDEEALPTASENCRLNRQTPHLVVGSADALRTGWADVAVANISGTVLLAILDDLQRVTRLGGTLVLTGFTDGELTAFQSLLPTREVLLSGEWRCIAAANLKQDEAALRPVRKGII